MEFIFHDLIHAIQNLNLAFHAAFFIKHAI